MKQSLCRQSAAPRAQLSRNMNVVGGGVVGVAVETNGLTGDKMCIAGLPIIELQFNWTCILTT